MGLIQDWLQRLREKRRERENYERGEDMQEGFHQRKKSNNERLLERYQAEEREKRIKQRVEALKKRENDKVWSGRQNNAIYAPNMIANQKKLFAGEATLTKAPCLFGQQHSKPIRRRKKRK